MKRNNSGYSLVELIASIAILAVASVSIMGFLVVCTQNYGRQNDEVDVQYEAQTAMNQISDMLISTKKGVSYSYKDAAGQTMILKDDEITSAAVEEKTLTIYADDVTYYVLTWSAADKKIYYSEYQKNGSGWDLVAYANKALLAEYVEDMSVDLSTTGANQTVRLTLGFQKDRTYELTQNVTIRNAKLKINKTRDEVY